jgi:hypothetical protein
VFIIPKALLCNSSPYFKAALNGTFIEGQTQSIDLDDEAPSIFRTYVAWLYQGHLNSRDLDDPGDFGLHIAQVLVFADKRNIRELEDDAISMLLSYLNKTGLATLEAINCIYDMPESAKISNLRKFLAQDEVWFGRRLKKKIAHWHPEFMAKIIEIYQMDEPKPSRVLETFVTTLSALLCKHLHEHTTEEPSCSSLVRNIYLAPSPPARERPNKKRKIIQTVEVLDD